MTMACLPSNQPLADP